MVEWYLTAVIKTVETMVFKFNGFIGLRRNETTEMRMSIPKLCTDLIDFSTKFSSLKSMSTVKQSFNFFTPKEVCSSPENPETSLVGAHYTT